MGNWPQAEERRLKPRGGKRPLRIFLSSTARDLSDHRVRVVESIERLGQQTVRMETFGARPGTPLEECRRLAAEADALVVCVAHRYGWVPVRNEGGDGTKSITWWEVESALGAGKPVFTFLVDPKTGWDGPRDEEPEALEGLARFRKFLDVRTTRETFSTPDNLALKVTTSLSRWLLEDVGTTADWTTGGVRAVPEPPPHYIPRPQFLEELKRSVLKGASRALAITAPGKAQGKAIMGVQGMGGIGKTVLAAAVARDPEVARAFPDGVYWITVGQQPRVLQMQQELAALAGLPEVVFRSEGHGKLVLRDQFSDRAVLLVLDDIWEIRQASMLDVVGLRGQVLMTTRNRETLVGLGAEEFPIEVLEPRQAQALLANWTGEPVEQLPAIADRVAKACGYLPLALAMIGAMIKLEPTAWEDALHRLETADLEKIRQDFPDYPYPDLLAALEVSVEALPNSDRDRYIELAVFSEDAVVPEAAVEVLWSSRGLDLYDCREMLRRLMARSLLRRDESGAVSLHDLQADYVRGQAHDLPALHSQLVDAYAERCDAVFAHGPDDGYFFQYLPYHLHEAGQKDPLYELLTNYHWLSAKLSVTSANAVVADFAPLSKHSELRMVAHALQLSAHALSLDASQLAGQLWGRLNSTDGPGINSLLLQAKQDRRQLRLRPRTPSLTQPGGALVRTLQGHSATVYSVSFLTSGCVVSAGDDTIRIWDCDSGENIRTLKSQNQPLSALAVLADGRLVSGSIFGSLCVWNADSGQGSYVKKDSRPPHGIMALVALRDGRIVSGSYDHTVSVWDPQRSEPLLTLVGHSAPVRALAALDDNRVVSSSRDSTLRIWDTTSGQMLRLLEGHSSDVKALTVGKDGNIISASADRTLRIWDSDTGKSMRTIHHREDVFTAVASLPDGRIVSGASNGKIRVWDIATGTAVRTFRGHSEEVYALATLDDGRIVSGAADQMLRVWNPDGACSLRTTQYHSSRVTQIQVLGDDRFVTSSLDPTLCVWDSQTCRSVRTLRGHTSSVTAVEVLASGHCVSGDADGTLRVWNVDEGTTISNLLGHSAEITSVATLGDGRIVSADLNGYLRIWDVQAGKGLRTIRAYSNLTFPTVLAIGEGRILSAGDDPALHILDAHSGRRLLTKEFSADVTAVAHLPNGKIFTADLNGTLYIWDPKSGDTLWKLQDLGTSLHVATIQPDGRIIGGGLSGSLYIWHPDSAEALRTLRAHSGPIQAVATLDHGRIASGSADSMVRIWDPDTERVLAAFGLDAAPEVFLFLSATKTLVVGDATGVVHFLQLEDREVSDPIGDSGAGTD